MHVIFSASYDNITQNSNTVKNYWLLIALHLLKMLDSNNLLIFLHYGSKDKTKIVLLT